jgi:hypothetical protein
MFKKGDQIIFSSMGDSKPGVVLKDSFELTTRVEIEYRDVLSGKKSKIALTVSNNNLTLKN